MCPRVCARTPACTVAAGAPPAPEALRVWLWCGTFFDRQDLAGRVMMENGIVEVELECEYPRRCISPLAAFRLHCSISRLSALRMLFVRLQGERDARLRNAARLFFPLPRKH